MSRYVYLPEFDIRAVFDDQKLEDLIYIARGRVLTAFDHATEQYRGRVRGTDNYIGGVGKKQKELVAYVQNNTKPFLNDADLPILPPRLMSMSGAQYAALLVKLHQTVLSMAVNSMVKQKIVWYEETGLWCVTQSAMDEWHASRSSIRASLNKSYVNRRNYHGKVRAHSRRRGVPAGAANSWR